MLALWFSSWVFLITATTIVSGCLAERARFEVSFFFFLRREEKKLIKIIRFLFFSPSLSPFFETFKAYLAYTPVMAGLAFPLAVHWAFHGWLSDAPCSYIDFAGGSTVHLLGGAAGLAASLAVGPRLGRDPERGGGGGRGGRSSSRNGGGGGGGGDGGGGSVELAGVEGGRPSASAGGPSSPPRPPPPPRESSAPPLAVPPPPPSSSSVSGSSSSSSAAPDNSGRTAATAASPWSRKNGNGSGNSSQKRRKGGGGPSQTPRRLRLRQPTIPGHNVESVTLGTLMLWFGWYGFIVAPAYLRGGPLLSNRTAVAVRAAVSTTLSACASGLSALGLGCYFSNPKAIDLRAACNGVLGGIVAATALCAFVEPWAAGVVGALAGAALVLSTWALEELGVDDPLDSVSVHGSCALVGLLGAAFLARPQHLDAYRGSQLNRECGGLFYLRFGRSGWEQLGIQLAGVAAISALSFSLSALVFFGMRAAGVLRVDTATEIAGIDHVDHGGPAYPDFELKTRE